MKPRKQFTISLSGICFSVNVLFTLFSFACIRIRSVCECVYACSNVGMWSAIADIRSPLQSLSTICI